MRIEWRNSVTETEISRTPNLITTPSLTTDYQQFSVSAPVPVGANLARIVYAIQTYDGGPGNTGTVYLDDASFEVVPEPAAGLLGVIALALGCGVRRRR
jgi:MYXO-CTERM domain-containing protein